MEKGRRTTSLAPCDSTDRLFHHHHALARQTTLIKFTGVGLCRAREEDRGWVAVSTGDIASKIPRDDRQRIGREELTQIGDVNLGPVQAMSGHRHPRVIYTDGGTGVKGFAASGQTGATTKINFLEANDRVRHSRRSPKRSSGRWLDDGRKSDSREA